MAITPLSASRRRTRTYDDRAAEINQAFSEIDDALTAVAASLASKQPLDVELTALAALDSAADRLPYFTGLGAAALAVLTAAGRALIAGATAAAQRTTLGLNSMATQDAAAVAITGGTAAFTAGMSANLIAATTSLGYSAGAGGTVTQATSKSTGVTLNKACGRITMDAAALADATAVVFRLSNTFITGADVVIVNVSGGATAGAYMPYVTGVGLGFVDIAILNRSGGSLSEAVELNFTVLQAVTT